MASLAELLDYDNKKKQALSALQAGADVINRGSIAGTLGAPVDLANMALGAVGLGSENPVLGSEWIGQKMEKAGMVSPERRPLAEFAAGFVNPETAATKGVMLAKALASKAAPLHAMALINANPLTDVERTQNLSNFMKGSHPELFDKSGNPIVLMHGSTADIKSFDPRKATIESDQGAGIYLTNSKLDASKNYAGEGPDLTNKIERYVDRYRDDSELSEKELRDMARQDLGVENLGTMYPVHVSMKNPVVIENTSKGKGSTFFDFDANYDKETEDYGEPAGALANYMNALLETGDEFQINPDTMNELNGKLYEHAIDYGGITANDLEKIVKEHLAYEVDPDTGDIASNEIWRKSLENAGYDGIIDKTVDTKFGTNKKGFGNAKLQGMTGVDKNTIHYIAFKPNQIKSAIGNKGTFDPKNASITAGIAAPLVGGAFLMNQKKDNY